MLEAVVTNVLWGWLRRRAQEIAGLVAFLMPIYLAMTPAMQADVQAILTGHGGALSITSAIGILVYLYTQFQSFRATTKPQVVTADGQKIAPAAGSVTQAKVDAIAKSAPVKETLWERISGSFAR